MSAMIDKAVEALNAKVGSFDSVAKFVITDEGAIMLDESGARVGDEPAEITMTASADTFEGILNGSVNSTTAFMTGRLKVDGSMGLAMKLGSALA